MIPKIIHYCWFGHNPLPKEAKKCIRSWKKYCKDYEIKEWNEGNFNIAQCPLYVREAYDAQKWAFVSDYARLKIVHDNGGIYMDTDVELLKSLDSLLVHNAYFGFDAGGELVATGLGFGAEKETPILYRMMRDYDEIPFYNEDGSMDETCCPSRNTTALLELGLKSNNSLQVLPGDILVLPSEYMDSIGYWNRTDCITENSISVHWYFASWLPEDYLRDREKQLKKYRYQRKITQLKILPNRVCLKLLGMQRYEKVKTLFKRH
jgi:hypothetical protein